MSTTNAMTTDIDAIRKRVDAATPGPWVTGDRIGLESWQAVLSPTGRMVGLDWDQSGKADAAFIASAREDVPALLAVIDHLKEKHAGALALAMRRGEEISRLHGELAKARVSAGA